MSCSQTLLKNVTTIWSTVTSSAYCYFLFRLSWAGLEPKPDICNKSLKQTNNVLRCFKSVTFCSRRQFFFLGQGILRSCIGSIWFLFHKMRYENITSWNQPFCLNCGPWMRLHQCNTNSSAFICTRKSCAVASHRWNWLLRTNFPLWWVYRESAVFCVPSGLNQSSSFAALCNSRVVWLCGRVALTPGRQPDLAALSVCSGRICPFSEKFSPKRCHSSACIYTQQQWVYVCVWGAASRLLYNAVFIQFVLITDWKSLIHTQPFIGVGLCTTSSPSSSSPSKPKPLITTKPQ